MVYFRRLFVLDPLLCGLFSGTVCSRVTIMWFIFRCCLDDWKVFPNREA